MYRASRRPLAKAAGGTPRKAAGSRGLREGNIAAITGLANGNVGQQLVLPLLENGEILQFGPRVLAPFYEERSRAAQFAVREYFGPTGPTGPYTLAKGPLSSVAS